MRGRFVGSRSTVLSKQFALNGAGDVGCLAPQLAVFTPRERGSRQAVGEDVPKRSHIESTKLGA